MTLLKAFLWNLLIAAEQLLNTLAFGDPDDTLSSRLGKAAGSCRLCRAVCRLLGKIDGGHCEKSIEPDEGKDGIFK